MMVVALCPLAKIFQPYYHIFDPEKGFKVPAMTVTQAQLMKNPELMWKKEPFSITVKRETGAIHMIYNQPRNIPEQMVRHWLANENCHETDCYGIVEMPLDPDAAAAMTYFAAQGKSPTQDLLEKVAEARQKAEEASLRRVMSAVRSVNNAMRRQYELNDEQKLGDFQPSPVEYLCVYALAEEQSKSQAELAVVKSKFKELMALTAPR